jgi:ABC-type nitrate/sulfonate/bicarbonate transport system substrate-binding protein
MTDLRIGRRAALLGAAGGLAAAAPARRARAQAKPIRIGWNPLAGGSAAITMLMIRDKLLEDAARQLGETITVEWKSFPNGPAATEAIVAGQLDMDMHVGSLPTVNRFVRKVPAVPFGVVGSHISNAVMVPPHSPIKRVEDLAGKRIGFPIGTTAHYLLASIIKIQLGKSLPQAGIQMVNMPAVDAVKIPSGIDAAVVWVPLRFIGPQMGYCEMLVDGDGRTGAGAAQPGIQEPAVKQSWAYPEGYNTDRLYAFAHHDLLQRQPAIVTAFLTAHMEAQRRALAAPEELVKLASTRWQQDPVIARTTLQTYAETAGIRQAPYLLEWDVLTLVKASEFLRSINVIDDALTIAALAPTLTQTAAQQKQAWDAAPEKVTLEAMAKGFSGKTALYGPIVVNGGAPVWQWQAGTGGSVVPDWGQRLYKPGPF